MELLGKSLFPIVFGGWLVPCLTLAADDPVAFNRDIRPLLQEHCVACHGGVKQAADLSLIYREKALAVIEPGDSAESELMARVTAESEFDRMPPPEHGPRLTSQEVDLLQSWIAAGAKWQNHWAFEQPERSSLPAVSDRSWARQRIDHFILARMEKEQLVPAPPAEPERWLRRASLDLIGLPPTPEERATFLRNLAQLGQPAYEQAVDRLLASPQFGERWAAMWLDLVRYADSKGLGQDGRRTIWKYRDWVINAFNQDMPFDEFTVKQIAGDLLPDPTLDDLVATAAHRLTQTNEEGGTDDEQFRIEAVIDRVNTTWQVWHGITFGCVQCHSHPYEPIEHGEYYRFFAFFNNTVDSDLSNDEPAISVPRNPADYHRAETLDQQIKSLQFRHWKSGHDLLADSSRWTPIENFSAKSNNATKVVVEENAGEAEFHTEGTVSKDTAIILDTELPAGVGPITAIRVTGFPHNPAKASIDSEWGFVISSLTAEMLVSGRDQPQQLKFSFVIADEPFPLTDPQQSLNAKGSRGFGAYSRIHYPREAAFVLEEPVVILPGSRLRITIDHKITELGAFPLVTKRGRLAVSRDPEFTRWLNDSDRQQTQKEIEGLIAQRKEIPSARIPVMRRRFATLLRPTHVFDRGNFLTKSEYVEPNTPALLPSLQPAESPTRLDLAHWMTSRDNPLASRVIVNRIWGQMFGRGIVETQEDFGSTGSAPSHPRLLDDLAVRFVTEMDWSIKRLLKEIALSSTYRQSSRTTEPVLEKDPANRFLSRGPRIRLPAETVRDQALSIAGLLSKEMYGPPVHPPIPQGVWNPFQASDKWETPQPEDPDRYRRSIYTYVKRTIPYPMFAAFDAPSREFCTARRLRSNTPLQALMTLNDQTLVEASEAFALRMLREEAPLREQITNGFVRATCREPSEAELKALVALYERTLSKLASQPNHGRKTADQSLEQRALSQVALVLLNLDEVLCK